MRFPILIIRILVIHSSSFVKMRFIYFMVVLISIIRVDVVKYQGFAGEMISVIFVPLIIMKRFL